MSIEKRYCGDCNQLTFHKIDENVIFDASEQQSLQVANGCDRQTVNSDDSTDNCGPSHCSSLADLRSMDWREPTLEQQWEDGTQILAAVRVLDSRTRQEYWEYAVVTVEADEGHFALTCNDEPRGWEYENIERFVVLAGRVFDA
jgi:hypothetical protein